MKEDRRPDPRPRKHPLLWQSYLWWDELMQMHKRHELRASSIGKGKSSMDLKFEEGIMENIEPWLKLARKDLAMHGRQTGPVWRWMTGIRGVGDHTAAKILAQFDDPARYATVSKFWRFAGWAVIDGEIDRCKKGEKSPYNRRLKSECYLLAEQFVRHQTPYYADLYYAEKARQRELHPYTLCKDCSWESVRSNRTEDELNEVIALDEFETLPALLGEIDRQFGKYAVKWEDCKHKKTHRRQFNDGHLHHRALRKTIKRFLSHLWVVWRESEGLPAPPPYVQTVLGHTNIDPPPGWPLPG